MTPEERKAFKERMKQLKAYREQNPGKGYWDFMGQLAEFKAKEWGEPDANLVLTQMLNDNTYNYKQMYEENPSMKPEEGHFTDRYKTFYHPTFSDESMYSGKKSQYNPDGYVGGTWDENNKIFHLGKGQNRKRTQEYLDRADPGYKAYQPGGETGDDDWLSKYTPEQQKLIKRGWTKPYDTITEESREKAKSKAKEIDRQFKLVSDALHAQAKQIGPAKEALEEAAANQVEERKDKFYPYKLGLKSTYEAAKLLLAGGGMANGVKLLQGKPATNWGNSSELAGEVIDGLEGTAGLIQNKWDDVAENAAQFTVGELGRRNYKPHTVLDGRTGADITPWTSKARYKGLIGLGILGNAYQIYDSGKQILGYQTGGKTGDDEPLIGTTQYDAYGNTTYYLPVSLSNDTLNIGLPDIPITVKDNLNLAAAVQAGQDQIAGIGKEVFANLTPYGDLESAVYAYDAAKNKDWLGLGLAGLGMLPLIPGGMRKVKSATRPIPTVNKGLVESQLNRSFDQLSKDAALRAQVANEQYRVIERLMDDPAYMNRANQVAKQFGDNYVPTYADAMLMYDIGPEALPWVKLNDEVDSFGRMERLADGRYIYHRSKAISQPNTTEHELNHFMDMLKANSGNAEEGNKMFKEMNKDLKHEIDRHDRYFMDPSEQKAHMNQLREWMFQNNMLETRDQEVTVNELKKALKAVENVPGMEGVIRASKQFGDLKKYRKWFNTVPLVSVSPLMLNSTAREEEAV